MIITPARREQRLADLRQRTGLPVKRVEIGRINFLNDTAALRVFYAEPAGQRPARTMFADKSAREADNDDD